MRTLLSLRSLHQDADQKLQRGPTPANYLWGRKRKRAELDNTFLVALNFILLKLDDVVKLTATYV